MQILNILALNSVSGGMLGKMQAKADEWRARAQDNLGVMPIALEYPNNVIIAERNIQAAYEFYKKGNNFKNED